MTTRKSTAIYEESIRLARDYFGADAAKHIRKVMVVHLRKSPERLSKADLVSLIDWIEEAASFLTDDQAAAQQYAKDLLALAEPGKNAKTS